MDGEDIFITAEVIQEDPHWELKLVESLLNL